MRHKMRSNNGMIPLVTPKLIPAVSVAAGAVVLTLWLSAGRSKPVEHRRPGGETTPAQLLSKALSPGTATAARTMGVGTALPEFRGTLVRSEGVPASLTGHWPRFRGEKLDNVSDENVRLARSWGPGGPAALWDLDVGEGYAGAAVRAGRVYLLDYDRENQADALRCLSLADGKEIWRYSYPVLVKRNHGMSRTVPTVTDEHVVALGPKCHVICLDAKSGELRWGVDLVRQYGTKVPPWYAGQCPLIDAGRAILGVGGRDVLMMAVDCATGEPVWQTENPRGWQMTHSSVMPVEYNGQRMYVYCASGGVVGVGAEDGRILWETDAWKIRIATVPSPVSLADGRIFVAGGYNAGSMMLQLADSGQGLAAEPLFRLKPEVFGAPQHTPILHKGHLYGVRPDGELACLDLKGNVLWTSGSGHRFGLGPYLIADGLIFVMNDSGLLALAEATPAGYNQLAQAQVLQGHESWAPMAIAGGRLILRDLTRMVCLDVRAQGAANGLE